TWDQLAAAPFGSAHAVAIDPSTPDTVYVGTAFGVLKSTNGGADWFVVSGLSITAVGPIAIDPAVPPTLYAATANGVFKSVDAGVTWNEADNGLGTPADHFAFSIALDPAKPGTLYAPTAHGLFKTTDGAASWIALPIGANNVTVDVSTPDSV